jgi:hypothetical protein
MSSDRNAPERSPNGCRWCGIARLHHGGQWAPDVGWHTWVAPSDEQRKERMHRRREGGSSSGARDYCSASVRASSNTSRSS